MTIQTLVQNSVSGDNLIGHTVTAAAFGDGLSSISVWALQTFAHTDVPAAVSQGVTALCMVLASYILQKISS